MSFIPLAAMTAATLAGGAGGAAPGGGAEGPSSAISRAGPVSAGGLTFNARPAVDTNLLIMAAIAGVVVLAITRRRKRRK